MALNLKNLADELKKKLQTGASNVGRMAINSLPSSQGFNAGRQAVTPQIRQSVQSGINFGMNQLNRGAPLMGPLMNIGLKGATPIKTGIKPLDYMNDRSSAYINNTYVASAKDIPQAFNQIRQGGTQNIMGKNVSNRLVGTGRLALDVLGVTPDPSDVAFGGYNYLKGAMANKQNGVTGFNAFDNVMKSVSMENPVGLGNAVTKNPTLQSVLNIAELPLILGATFGKAKFDAKQMKKALPEIRNVRNLLGNMEDIPELTMAQQRAVEETVKKVAGLKYTKELGRLATASPREYFNFVRGLFDDAEYSALNPQVTVGLSTKARQSNVANAGLYDATQIKQTLSRYGNKLDPKQADKLSNVVYSLRNLGGDVSSVLNPREKAIIDEVYKTLNNSGIDVSTVGINKSIKPVTQNSFGEGIKVPGSIESQGFPQSSKIGSTGSPYDEVLRKNPPSASNLDPHTQSIAQKEAQNAFINDFNISKSTKFDFKPGETVTDLSGRKFIVKSGYIDNGIPKYDVYTPGKKNSNAYQFNIRASELKPNVAQQPVTDAVNPLIQEAKKYGSAEEFVIERTKPEIKNIYNDVLSAYKKEMPTISEEILNKNTTRLLQNLSGDNKALANFLHDGNKVSRAIVEDLTGMKWGKDINQTKIREGNGSLLNTILEKRGINKSQLTDIYNQSKGVTKGVESMPVKKVGEVTTENKVLNTQLPEQIKSVASQVPLTDSVPQYKRGVIADSERKIDEIIGFNEGMASNRGEIEKMRQDLISYVKRDADPKTVKELNKLQEIIEGQRFARQEEAFVKQELQSNKISQLQAQRQIEKINNSFDKKFSKSIDSLKLDKKYFQIYRDEIGKSFGVENVATEKSLLKTSAEQAKLKEKAFIEQNKQANKAMYGDYGVKPMSKSIDDLAKTMKSSTNQGILDNADNWKDKPKIFLTRETMERNITDMMGKDAPVVKEKLIQPIFKAEAERTRFLNKERSDIAGLGIKARSKESEFVQLLGEGKVTREQLPLQSANKIIKAESVLRQKYDTYLTQLNTVLTRNGYDPIPKRKDYFHHFEDLNGAFEQIGVALKANDLPTDINGLSADFKPGKTFFNASLQRKGDKTSIDAITGIDKYLNGASNQIYHTDNIQNLRAFETAIREKYVGTDHLTNFVADLGEYTNKLAGKKSMVDRAAESIVGRRIYAGANALKSQVGANMVGGNISSALTNFIPVTQTLATTDKPSVVQAMMGIIKNVGVDDGFVNKSNFLTSRVGSDSLAMTNWQKVGSKANWLFKVVDSFTSQLAVRSKYLEGIKKGLSEGQAMRNADDWGRKVMAGRSAGEVPTLFNAKTLGFFTQFQLEVNNQMSFMAKDIPNNFSKAGAASALGQLFLYSYLFNNLYEKAIGRRPAFDPIGVAQQTYEDYTSPNMKKGQATKNLLGNVSDQLPFASTLTGGRIPLGAAIPDVPGLIKGETTLGKELVKPLTYLLPPTGGGQIKKFIDGTRAYNKGASTTDSGNVRYPIPQTTANRIKTSLFGQYSTPEARKYFREGTSMLGSKQSEAFMDSNNKQDYYQSIIEQRGIDKAIDSAKLDVEKSHEDVTVGGRLIYWDSKTGAVRTKLVTPLAKKTTTKTTKIARAKKVKGPKKPKKITIKYTAYKPQKITIKKSGAKVSPTIKFKKPKKLKLNRKYSIK